MNILNELKKIAKAKQKEDLDLRVKQREEQRALDKQNEKEDATIVNVYIPVMIEKVKEHILKYGINTSYSNYFTIKTSDFYPEDILLTHKILRALINMGFSCSIKDRKIYPCDIDIHLNSLLD